jgi:hypothetical protein
VLDAFGAVGVGDDQVEAVAFSQLANLTSKMTALLRVEPDHVALPRRGPDDFRGTIAAAG